MTKGVDPQHANAAFRADEGLPHAPMTMPEQTLERQTSVFGARLLWLPALSRSRMRAR